MSSVEKGLRKTCNRRRVRLGDECLGPCAREVVIGTIQ